MKIIKGQVLESRFPPLETLLVKAVVKQLEVVKVERMGSIGAIELVLPLSFLEENYYIKR